MVGYEQSVSTAAAPACTVVGPQLHKLLAGGTAKQCFPLLPWVPWLVQYHNITPGLASAGNSSQVFI